MKVCFLTVLIFFMGSTMLEGESSVRLAEKSDLGGDSNGMKITIIYDNKSLDENLKTEWGFSCLIQSAEKTILFDTGGYGEILLHNMEKLNISTNEIDAVFLSLEDWDHTGGLQDFLAQNRRVIVYVLKSFSREIRDKIENSGAESIEITSPAYFCERVATTGDLDTVIAEQSLVLETDKGLIIIVGCAHPGIVSVIQRVKDLFDQEIYMVIGGFHLGAATDAELTKIIEEFRTCGIEKVGPCHCSGERCRVRFSDEYKENFVDIGAGKVILVHGRKLD